MFFRRRAEPEVIVAPPDEPEVATVPSVIQVSMADKAAEVIVIESIKTVLMRVAVSNNTQAEASRIEDVYANFRTHLNAHGYHLEIFI